MTTTLNVGPGYEIPLNDGSGRRAWLLIDGIVLAEDPVAEQYEITAPGLAEPLILNAEVVHAAGDTLQDLLVERVQVARGLPPRPSFPGVRP